MEPGFIEECLDHERSPININDDEKKLSPFKRTNMRSSKEIW
jgi:hypothetical protein